MKESVKKHDTPIGLTLEFLEKRVVSQYEQWEADFSQKHNVDS